MKDRNMPSQAFEDGELVFLGDSYTKGNCSVNYVDLVKNKLSGRNIKVTNAGINGEHSFGALARLESLIAAKPKFLTIFIGVNDVLLDYFPSIKKMASVGGRLPKTMDISLAGFSENVSKMVQMARKVEGLRILLVSIPVLGDSLDNKVNEKVEEYNEVLHDLALQHELNYLDIFSIQERVLGEKKIKPVFSVDKDIFNHVYSAMFSRHVLRRSWDSISLANGMLFSIDGLHLNTRAADIIADYVMEFMYGKERRRNG